MSGLVGYIAQNKTVEPEELILRKKVFENILLAMQDRGEDATGIAAYNGDSATIFKDTVEAKKFIKQREYDDIMRNDPPIMIGWTSEAPTTGYIKNEETLPLRDGHIVGTHDGYVINADKLVDRMKVDSEAIFMKLWLTDNDYKKVFPMLEGTLTSAWLYEKKPNNLYLLRNDNPLWVAMVQPLKTMFYCSEKFTLESIIRTATGKDVTAWKPEEDHVYTISRKFEIKKDKVTFKTDFGDDALQGTVYDDFEDREDWAAGYGGSRGYHNDNHYGTGYESSGWYAKRQAIKKIIDDFDLTDINILRLDIQMQTGKCKGKGCKVDILDMTDGFYWDYVQRKLLCYECATTTDKKFKDSAFITFDEYASLVDEINWNTIFRDEQITALF